MKRLSLLWKEFSRNTHTLSGAMIYPFVLVLSLAICLTAGKVENTSGYTYESRYAVETAVLEKPEEVRTEWISGLLQEIQVSLRIGDAENGDGMKKEEEEYRNLIPADVAASVRLSRAVQDILTQIEEIGQYPVFLQEIQHSANRMKRLSSMTGNSTYSDANIQKTAEDYAVLSDIQPVFDRTAGILCWSDAMKMITWLMLAIALFVCFMLFSEEQLYASLYAATRYGLNRLKQTKVLSALLIVLICFSAAGITATLFTAFRFGFGDLSRAIQSVYSSCAWRISVGQFLILQSVWSLLLIWTFTCGCCLLCTRMKHPGLILVLIAGWIAAEAGISRIPSGSGAQELVRNFSMVHFLQHPASIAEYGNLNLFGIPVHKNLIAGGWTVFRFLVLFLAAMKPGMASSDRSRMKNGCRRAPNQKQRGQGPVNLWLLEANRIIRGQKVGALLLMLLAGFGLWSALAAPSMTAYEAYQRSFIEKAVQTDDPGEWLKEQYEKIAGSQEDSDSLRARAILSAIEQASALPPDQTAQLLFSAGYREWLAGDTNFLETILMTLFIASMVLMTASERADELFCTMPGDRKRNRIRAILLLSVTAIVFFVLTAADAFRIQNKYTLPQIQASAGSLLWLKTEGIPIFAAVMLFQLTRLFSFLALGTVLFLAGKKNPHFSLAVIFVFILLPLLLSWSGVRAFAGWPFTQLLRGSIFLRY